MRAVIQRVKHANVSIDKAIKSEINNGLLILLGITNGDIDEDRDWIIKKILNMRIFNDDDGKMNLSVVDIQGELLVISQFTLFASIKKGNRPSYISAAKPEIAIPIYESFIENIIRVSKLKVGSGTFGADMKVSLLNDGPVTIIIDSKNRV